MTTADSHPFEDAFGDLFHALNTLPFPYCLMDVLSVLQRQATSLDYAYITDWAKWLGIWEERQYVQSQAESSKS
ncbi:MAG: hypothetical protein HP497_06710 [Nitrospira sp.]|nr:hypothetical protein [Nitrospira sp.]